jgi:hypothetical protein
LSEGFSYEWIWTAAQGHSGGTLVGVRTDNCIVISKDSGDFFSSMEIISKQDDFKWEVVNVYWSVQVGRKTNFLEELSQKFSSMEDPFIMGGDFNLIRYAWENLQEM